ncbi:MAG: MBL fold metallo-hydrolase [Bacteroidales bacterium]|nr:MBL fold metallo-hydrolase [Bacteroidales bacterium]
MKVKKFQVNPFPVNTYVIYDENSKECAIIDPGCYWDEERKDMEKFIEDNDLKVKHLLHTHLHLDHILSTPYFSKKYNIPFAANKKDEFLLIDGPKQASQWGLKLEFQPIAIEKELNENDIFNIGDSKFIVKEVPGHSPGSVVFYDEKDGIIFTGDVLFNSSIGRTDLKGGNHQDLIDNIRNKILVLPEETVVYSGHGQETTIGYEKKFNPYLR